MNTVTFTRILCPTDLSPESDGALRNAVALARTFGAKLSLLYCAPRRDGRPTGRMTRGTRALFEDALAKNADVADCASLDWDGEVVETDSVGATIADHAAARHVDLIVMLSRRRPHHASLLGATAEEVCRAAPCPVLVTHPDERTLVDPDRKAIALDRILVAQDFSDDSELAVQYGISLATTVGGCVDLLHVLPHSVPDQPDSLWSPDAAEQAYYRAAHLLRESVPSEQVGSTTIRYAVRWGKPYAEILSYAQEHRIDLVCMGARGAGYGMWSLFGSNVDRVLRQTECPLLVVRPLKPTLVASTGAVSIPRASRPPGVRTPRAARAPAPRRAQSA
jgi:nucleotide-binding universal stress UspA family protein